MKSLVRQKKGSRLRLCFRVVDDVPEKGTDLWKQMSSSKCSFKCVCGVFSPLHPSTPLVYARSAFYPSPRFTLSLQSAFYTQSAIYPWPAVCSPQSAFYTDRSFYKIRTSAWHGTSSIWLIFRHVVLEWCPKYWMHILRFEFSLVSKIQEWQFWRGLEGPPCWWTEGDLQ